MYGGRRNCALKSGKLLGQRVGEAQDWLMDTQLPISDTCKTNSGVPRTSKYHKNTTQKGEI